MLDSLHWGAGRVAGLPVGIAEVRLAHDRVDAAHSNPYEVWKTLGSPTAPTQPQYAQMEAAAKLGALSGAPASAAVAEGVATLSFALPRQGVSLLVLSW